MKEYNPLFDFDPNKLADEYPSHIEIRDESHYTNVTNPTTYDMDDWVLIYNNERGVQCNQQ